MIVLPEPFTITSANEARYARNQDINITWDNSNKNSSMDAGFVLTCQGNQKGSAVLFVKSTKDDGRFSINAADIVNHPNVDVDTSSGCDAMVILRRSTEKKLDPRYGKGSYSLGVQERVVHFSIDGLAQI